MGGNERGRTDRENREKTTAEAHNNQPNSKDSSFQNDMHMSSSTHTQEARIRLAATDMNPISNVDSLSGILTPSAVLNPERGAAMDTERQEPREIHTNMVYFPMPMPSAGGPWFEGNDVSRFLRQYEAGCKNHGVFTETAKVEALPLYCNVWIADWVESLEAYKHRDWADLAKKLKKEFQDKDVEQKIYSRQYLESYSRQKRELDESTSGYISEYTAISELLVSRKLLDDYTRGLLFLKGMPEKLRNKILEKQEIDPEDPDTVNFERISAAALRYVESMS